MNTERRRILIVDDDEGVCNTLKAILKVKDYDVEIVNTGKEAIERAETTFYDVAILDIKLPDIEGTELLKPLHKISPKTIKIMLTGYPQSDNAIKSLNYGADAYLVKPLDPAELVKTIEEKLPSPVKIEQTNLPTGKKLPEGYWCECPGCGAYIGIDTRYCPFCKAELPYEQYEKPVKRARRRGLLI